MVTARIAAFTDTYLPTINGVTYAVNTWQKRWNDDGGTMDVVYPGTETYPPQPGEYPVRSIPFLPYQGVRLASPLIPSALPTPDLIHAHTPFGVGLAGYRLAKHLSVPFIASYHTPTEKYSTYIIPNIRLSRIVSMACHRYERWFYDLPDAIVAPSNSTAEFIEQSLDATTPISVISNGVNIDFFRPIDPSDFLEEYGLEDANTLIGYTGRHGFEKRLLDIITGVAGLDVTLVLAGDGPARKELELQAATVNTDIRFLGFLDRSELPAFYSALDVFTFPSPVETQGLVALEANACGTPVIGPACNGLTETIIDGVTGYHYHLGDLLSLHKALFRAIENRTQLRKSCLARRGEISVDHSIQTLEKLYADHW